MPVLTAENTTPPLSNDVPLPTMTAEVHIRARKNDIAKTSGEPKFHFECEILSPEKIKLDEVDVTLAGKTFKWDLSLKDTALYNEAGLFTLQAACGYDKYLDTDSPYETREQGNRVTEPYVGKVVIVTIGSEGYTPRVKVALSKEDRRKGLSDMQDLVDENGDPVIKYSIKVKKIHGPGSKTPRAF